MLLPTKFTNPDRTVINLSLIFIEKLRRERLISFEDLKILAKENILGGDSIFFETINFLFLIGLLEYRKKIDSFEYTGQ